MMRQLRVVAAALIAIGAIVLTPAAANAAPARPADNWWQCMPYNPGSQCDNTDPYQTGCASSKIYVASGTGNYYTRSTVTSTWQVQLYYSTACATIWARVQLLSGSNICPECELDVVRSNFNSSIHDTSDVGSLNGNLYSGAWTNQLYLPCGGTLTGSTDLWQAYQGTLGSSNNWYPGC